MRSIGARTDFVCLPRGRQRWNDVSVASDHCDAELYFDGERVTLPLETNGGSLVGLEEYVLNPAFEYQAGSVSAINVGSNAQIANIPWSSNQGLVSIAASPSGSDVYVVSQTLGLSNDGGTLTDINVATNTVTSTLALSEDPGNIVISPSGAYAYVGNYDWVDVVDLATDTIIHTVNLDSGSGPNEMVLNAAGTQMWIAPSDGDDSVINLSTYVNTDTGTQVNRWVSPRPRGISGVCTSTP